MAKNLRHNIKVELQDGSKTVFEEEYVFRTLSKKQSKEIIKKAKEFDEKQEEDARRYAIEYEEYEEALSKWKLDGSKGKKPKEPKEPYENAIDDAWKARADLEIVSGDKKALFDLMDEWGGAFVYSMINEAVEKSMGKH